MTDIPIIMSAPMVLASLEGRKTATRRLAWGKKCRKCCGTGNVLDKRKHPTHPIACPRCRGTCFSPSSWQDVKPDTRLWVRENFRVQQVTRVLESGGARLLVCIDYEAGTRTHWNLPEIDCPKILKKRGRGPSGEQTVLLPAIHMPRIISRLTLIVTATKIERLQDIRETDCIAEGAQIIRLYGNPVDDGPMVRLGPDHVYGTPRTWFRELWDELHGPGAWDANPEVVALTFVVHKQNIDALARAA
jgi:hypothetical protein